MALITWPMARTRPRTTADRVTGPAGSTDSDSIFFPMLAPIELLIHWYTNQKRGIAKTRTATIVAHGSDRSSSPELSGMTAATTIANQMAATIATSMRKAAARLRTEAGSCSSRYAISEDMMWRLQRCYRWACVLTPSFAGATIRQDILEL